jgi:hypothetical protein
MQGSTAGCRRRATKRCGLQSGPREVMRPFEPTQAVSGMPSTRMQTHPSRATGFMCTITQSHATERADEDSQLCRRQLTGNINVHCSGPLSTLTQPHQRLGAFVAETLTLVDASLHMRVEDACWVLSPWRWPAIVRNRAVQK